MQEDIGMNYTDCDQLALDNRQWDPRFKEVLKAQLWRMTLFIGLSWIVIVRIESSKRRIIMQVEYPHLVIKVANKTRMQIHKLLQMVLGQDQPR